MSSPVFGIQCGKFMDRFHPEKIKQWSVSAERILLITGAGISVDSGIPTYRGVTGLYDQAGTEDGIPKQEGHIRRTSEEDGGNTEDV